VFRAGIVLFTVLLATSVSVADTLQETSYQSLNQELGVVYRPPSVPWDGQQWDAIFQDPAPPMGWAVLPVGAERCGAIMNTWLNNARRKNLRLAIVFTPLISTEDMRRTIDCAIPLGFRRAVVDEYISYQTINKGRPICTVISELRSLSTGVKQRYPSFEFFVNDNWHAWMIYLARGQSPNCGAYPHFRVDMAGVSVLSKYKNPLSGGCDHPTSQEMIEQLIDLKPTLKDYSRTGRVFAWQLNQNWYPGGERVLQMFRQLKAAYGWERFFLFGPTTDHPTTDNWGYNTRGRSENCASRDLEWYLPARQYLIRIGEGTKPSLTLTAPTNVSRGSVVPVRGRIATGTGLRTGGIELQYIPPSGSPQSFTKQIVAPSNAFLAFVGVRVNAQLPNPIKGPAHFWVQRAQLFEAGSSDNKVTNGEFDNGLNLWLSTSSARVGVITSGSEKSLEVQSTATQNASITSSPISVRGGRTYIVNFDARIFTESRNGAYFYVSWNNPGEIRKDRMFASFPLKQTLAATSSGADGRFQFSWQPTEPGIYQLFTFFKGTRLYQPVQAAVNVNVN
jgi:hypothetical protein